MNRYTCVLPSLLIVLSIVIASCGGIQPAVNVEATVNAQVQATLAAVSAGTKPTPKAPIPTAEVKATETRVLPTSTPIPSLTPLSDTLPGTVLEVGQAWRQGGLELVVRDTQLGYDNGVPGIYVTLKLTSRKSQDIALRYNLADLMSAQDNMNRRLKIVPPYSWVDEWTTYNVVLHSNQTIGLYSFNDYPPFVEVDIADPAITNVVVTISISSISNARWNIPIPH